MAVFRGVVRIDAEWTGRNFPSQEEAERWAYDIGVRRWILTEYHRARPFVHRIPISFPGSPSFEVLDDLLRKLAEGRSLSDLARDLQKQDAPDSRPIPLYILKLWLVGHDPVHPAIQRLRMGRRDKG